MLKTQASPLSLLWISGIFCPRARLVGRAETRNNVEKVGNLEVRIREGSKVEGCPVAAATWEGKGTGRSSPLK